MKTLFIEKTKKEAIEIISKLPKTNYFELIEEKGNTYLFGVKDTLKNSVKIVIVQNDNVISIHIEPCDKKGIPLIEKNIAKQPIESSVENAINLIIDDEIDKFKPVKEKVGLISVITFIITIIMIYIAIKMFFL